MIRLLKNRAGATAIEYALIAGLIALMIVTAAVQVGVGVDASFQTAADAF